MITVNDLLENLKTLLDKFYLRKKLSNSNEILITDSNKNVTTTSTITASKVSGLKTVATSGNYEDLTNKPSIPSAYTHPTFTAYNSGLYKITVNNEGHITGAVSVQASDLTSLGLLKGSVTGSNRILITDDDGVIKATNSLSANQVTYENVSLSQYIYSMESNMLTSSTYSNGVLTIQ